MAGDDVRSRVAQRVSSETTSLPTSSLGRRARWIGGLAKAGAKSLRRSVERAVGRDAEDVDAEAAIVASLGELKGPMMKVGQLLGTVDAGLPAPLRAALSALHTGSQGLDVA
jgi:predicted unusual protein kinase regulating ubiquinone biosynthesis (AarF/ABC1/UbiB family)